MNPGANAQVETDDFTVVAKQQHDKIIKVVRMSNHNGV